ncbi:MAG: hypothetical protein HY314_08810 [Acidobacteria bacterium]|nr:hypothetical protein [Acidobacteriota bacterium]
MGRQRECIGVVLLAILILQTTAVFASSEENGKDTGHRRHSAHPVGRTLPGVPQPRIVIKDYQCTIDTPVVPDERVVLTTVGIEHEENGETEFHPFVSIAVDKTFPEAPDGQWMAVWNLGVKSPGLLSRLRAIIPGFRATKHVREKELRQLDDELENFDEAKREVKVPEPYLDATHLYRRSTMGLVLAAITRGLDIANVFYPLQLMFRNYLIHRKDNQERAFQQGYVGLTWYGDLSNMTPEQEPLSPDAIQEIKFRLLANRSVLGRWMDRQMRDEFVFQFENQLRDHLWGTSSFLAGAANEYHLAYEELHRATESGVPIALGGILYYDPAVAPAPDRVKWSLANPFDLTYNPFTDPAVQRAAQASPGSKIPLAIYVYQSNHALKPIIVVDFFRRDNPRVRESARYWRKLANEAIAASDLGLFYSIVNRSLNFAANRKTSTWFSAKGPALGVEELRLSLEGHLYFEPETADVLLDQIDRRVVNPLVQPGRIQRLRAELHYQALLANGGEAVLHAARQVREKLIREVTENRQRPLASSDYAIYRQSVRKQPHLRRLETFLSDQFAGSVLTDHLIEALKGLSAEADGHDREVIDVLMRFRQRLENQFRAQELANHPINWELNALIARTDATLDRLYRASGKGPTELKHDLAKLAQQQAKEEAEAEAKWQKRHAKQFAQELDQQVKFLQRFVKDGADLTTFSPWYVTRALDFFRQVPEAISANPRVADKYRQEESRIRGLLNQVAQKLAAYRPPTGAEWLEEERFYCLEAVREVQTVLMAAAPERPPSPITGSLGVSAGSTLHQP